VQEEKVRIISVKGGTSKEKKNDWCKITYTQSFEDSQTSKGDEVFEIFYPSRKAFDMFNSKYKYVELDGYFEFRRAFDKNGGMSNKSEKLLKAVYDDKGNCILSVD